MRTETLSNVTRIGIRFGLCLALVACAQSTELPPAPNGQTHWLQSCGSSAACGDLSCVCGVCALRCSESLECSARIAGAQCLPAGAEATQSLCGELLAPAMCLMPCDSNDQCPATQSCKAGSCVPEPSNPFVDAGEVDGGGITHPEIAGSDAGATVPGLTTAPSGHAVGDCVNAQTSGWVAETLAVNIPFAAQVDSLLDRNGRVHLVYITGPSIVHRVLEDRTWHVNVIDVGTNYAWGIDMAEAPDGTIHVAAGGLDGLRHYALREALWSRTQVTSSFVRQVSIALDAEGEAQFVYADDEPRGLMHVERVDGEWVGTLIDEQGYPRGMSLVLGHPAGPEVLYYSGEVRYARRENGTWQVRTLGYGIDVAAVRINGNELMAAWGGHDIENMTLARLNDGQPAWSLTLDLPGNFGVAHPALALGQNNELHVLYRNASGYAYLRGTEDAVESTYLLDSESNYAPSLTLDATGAPHAFGGVGYFDGDLVHLHQGRCAP